MDKSSPGTAFRFNAPESEGSALIKTSNYPGHSIICGNLRRRRRSRLQKSSCPFKTGHPESGPRGVRRTLGKRVCGKPYRGFESHSLRQLGRSRVLSERTYWQLSTAAAKIFSFGLR